MSDSAFQVDSDSSIKISVSRLVGRGEIALDGQVLYDSIDSDGFQILDMRVLRQGSHRLDITSHDHGASKYDFQLRIEIQKADNPPILITQFRLKSTGLQHDKNNGKTLHFDAI